MNISVVNHTNGKVKDAELQNAIRAINRQIMEDFLPHWGMAARLRLEGRSAKQPDLARTADLRGDAIIYVWDKVDVDDATGYHEANARGVPSGFAFTEISKELGEDWSITLSHEALELIADPETNLLVMGPHPSIPDRDVFHWLEMCDAVQDEWYEIDGVKVSNFVLPLYFTGTRDTDEVGARNDFLGTVTKGQTLKSFDINPGGYIGFYNPLTKKHTTVARKGDKRAQERLETKGKAKQTRRSVRYRSFASRSSLRAGAPALAAAAPALAAAAAAAPRKPVQEYEEIGEPLTPKKGTSGRHRPSTD